MAYPPPVTKKERRVLAIIARGHPERTMHIRGTWGSGNINALEWTEVQIAVGMTWDEFGDCIAHLVGGDLIDSTQKLPGLLGHLTGKKTQYFYWATELGRKFLEEKSEDETPDAVLPSTADKATEQDIDDAARIYADSFSKHPYVKPNEVDWAATLLDEDVQNEIKQAALEQEAMWATFERMFGHRGPAANEKQRAVRDPAVKRSTVRVFRAKDEQRHRRGFGPSRKPEAWSTHYNGGDLGLDPPPWEGNESHKFFDQHMSVAEFRAGIDQFFARSGEDPEKYDFEERVMMFAAINSKAIYESGTNKKGFPAQASLAERAATLILATQAIHLLLRLSFPEGLGDAQEAANVKARVLPDTLALMLDTDSLSPSEEALRVIGRVSLVYGELEKSHMKFLVGLDSTWRIFLNRPEPSDAAALVRYFTKLVEMQEAS